MCLSPITLRNPTKRISLLGGQPLKLQVACGHCADCIKLKRNEWYFRSYHQTQDVLKKGGYIYFDTLTYSPKFIPMLSHFIDIDKYGCKDFSCFNLDHFKLFLKRLRRQIEYKYGYIEFKYFLTSEYGTDIRFTHRPHYHILFFVYDNEHKLHPLDFSRLVSDCWEYGRTDGIYYQPFSHVQKHIYGRDLGLGSNDTLYIIIKACNYVSKYVTKDSTFKKVLAERINYLEKRITDEDLLNKLKRNIDMFHRQSKGFGLSFLEHLTDDDVRYLYDGIVTVSDDKKVVNIISTPMYYKRHLFYNYKKRDDGTYFWELNDKGIEYTEQIFVKRIQTESDRLYNIYINADTEEKLIIDALLAGRSYNDFSIYNIFYRGRLRHNLCSQFDSLFVQNSLSDSEFNLYDVIKCISYSTKVNSISHGFVPVDGHSVQLPILYQQLHLFDNNLIYKSIDYDTFIKLFTFNENSDARFKNFDLLNSYLVNITKQTRNCKQQTFEFKENLEKRIKAYLYGRQNIE